MKKTILILSAAGIIAFFAFRTPPVVTMQFETLEVKILSLPTPNADSSLWTFRTQAWYGVKNNPYTKKVGSDYRWAQWADISVVSTSTDSKVVLPLAYDSANAYRQRIYPDIQ